MIGGVAVEEVRGELDRITHRAAEQLAQSPAGSAATSVKAGQLYARVTRHAERLQLACESTVRERVPPDHDLFRSLKRRRDIFAAVGFTNANDPRIRAQLDHIAEEVRPVAAAGGKQRRIGKCDWGNFQSGYGQCGLRRSDGECPASPVDSAPKDAAGHEPKRVTTQRLRNSGF